MMTKTIASKLWCVDHHAQTTSAYKNNIYTHEVLSALKIANLEIALAYEKWVKKTYNSR